MAADHRGPFGYLRAQGLRPDGNRPSEHFAVWRPCSMQALGMLFSSTATGKGLNIKGKSSVQGKLSGFVPFLQIDVESHKALVCTIPPQARTRVYFKTRSVRERARLELQTVLSQMWSASLQGHTAIGRHTNGSEVLDEAQVADALRMCLWTCSDVELLDVDEFAPLNNEPSTKASVPGIRLSLRPDARGMYGVRTPRLDRATLKSCCAHALCPRLARHLLASRCEPPRARTRTIEPPSPQLDMPQRLLWEACVARRDIGRSGEWGSGRPSEPAFMDLNLKALRDGSAPAAVLWQDDEGDPLNPLQLLMAHEEEVHGVRPVVSDLDAFLLGSKGMESTEPLAEDQVQLMHWCFDNMEKVLEVPAPQSWTKRWLQVVKTAASTGFHPNMPRFGYGDPKSYDIMASMVDATSHCGAVRHGPECFNYYFPQELDSSFLIVWHGFTRLPTPFQRQWQSSKPSAPWRYVTRDGLREFLLERICDGYTFPLNPKWVLCDPGWHEVFARLCSAPHAQAQLDTWLPPSSGLRERLTQLTRAHPNGFRPAVDDESDVDHLDQDLADWELHRHIILHRAKIKLRAIHRMGGFKRPVAVGESQAQAPT